MGLGREYHSLEESVTAMEELEYILHGFIHDLIMLKMNVRGSRAYKHYLTIP